MSLRIAIIIVLFSAVVALVPLAHAGPLTEEVRRLEQKLKDLEKELEESRKDSSYSDREVRSFLNTRLRLGGFMDSSFTGIFQENRSAQAASSSTFLGINLGAVYNERLRFNAQFVSGFTTPIGNPHDDPRSASLGSQSRRGFGSFSFTNLVTQAYGEWERSDAFRVQAGIGYAPYGITFQQLEPVLFVRRGGPQLLRTNDELVHPLWQGLQLKGQFTRRALRFGYHAYTFTPASNTQKLGLGSRIWLEGGLGGILLGFSQQTASRGDETYTTLGPDLRIRAGRFSFQSELAIGVGNGTQPWSVHVQPDFAVYGQSVLIYLFADYFESVFNKTVVLPDPYKKWEYGGGLNWLPTVFTRLRLGLTFHDYVGSYVVSSGGRDYWALDASAGVAF